MLRHRYMPAAAVFVVALTAGSLWAEARKAPNFTLETFEGKRVSLSDYRGRIVVLEWLNLECPFVQGHYGPNRTMVDLANKYKGQEPDKDKGVVWLAINSTSHTTPEVNREFAKKNGLPYPILDDRSGKVGRAYKAVTTPHLFVINRQGHIVYDGAIDNAPLGKLAEGAQAHVNHVDEVLAALRAGEEVPAAQTKPYGCSVKYGKFGGEAPDFTLESFAGGAVTLSELRGRIVVLEWFNQQCPFVKAHYTADNRTMIDLAKEYADKGVVWLAIDSTSTITPQAGQEFSRVHSLPYPILDDRSGKIGRAYSATNTPHMFIIDRRGHIVYDGAIDNAPLGKTPEGAEARVNYVDKALAEVVAGDVVTVEKTRPYGCTVKYAQ